MQTNFPAGIVNFRHPRQGMRKESAGLGNFFARAEGSDVEAWPVTPGFGLGPDFNDKSQVHDLVEAGVIF